MSTTLQMVGGKTYSHLKVKNGDTITRGELVIIDDDKLKDELLADFYLDGVDAECPYFAEYSGDDAKAGEVKPVSKRRTHHGHK